NQQGPFDVAIIEGTPITKEEIDLLKLLRKESKVLIGLGSCATLGGIPGILNKKERYKWYKKIYGDEYKPRGIDALPLTAYVPIDFLIHGCPINGDELVRILEELLSGKTPAYRGYSVCFECKQANNPCRLLDKKPCLGPIIQGGCKAICISSGSSCYGCFGLRKEPNIKALLTILQNITDKKEIDRYFTMFLNKVKIIKNKK
ncbi:MAG: hydrogenase, partial [bacterium]